MAESIRALAILAVLCSWPWLAHAGDQCPGPRDKSIRPKVVGGWAAKLQHWPGQVVLRLHNEDRRESAYFCGGSLIAPTWVLSAAHCFKQDNVLYFRIDGNGRYHTTMEKWGYNQQPLGFSGKAYLQIVAGVNDLGKVTDVNVSQVKRVIVHPDYTRAQISGHDIALVELDQPFDGQLARLSTAPQYDPATALGVMAMVAGFGDQKWKAPLNLFVTDAGARFAAGAMTLREVDLPTISTPDCAKRFPTAAIGVGQICAGHEQGLRDSCQGDSGGPLVGFDKKGCPYQVGVVSFGPPCAAKRAYGVYTRVSAYMDWIRQYVPKVHAVRSGDIVDPRSVASRLKAVDTALAELNRLLGRAAGGVSLMMRRIQHNQTTVDLDPDQNALKVQLNQRFLMKVKSNVEGRLVLVDIDSAGKVTQIFPNKFVRSDLIGRIGSGQTIQIPGQKYGFDWFRAQEPTGKSRILVLVVPDQFAIEYDHVAKEWGTKGMAPEKAPTNYLANLIDQIGGLLGARGMTPEKSPEEWAFKVVEYEIER